MTASHPSSRPVLLIHGFGQTTEVLWRRAGWIRDLEAADRTVIGIDLPGHGTESDDPDRDPADLILEQAAKHGSVDAVGFSIGAWALLAAAAERPELFHRIAVIGAGDMVLTQALHTPESQQPMIDVLRAAEAPKDNPMATGLLAQLAAAGNDRHAAADFLTADKRFPSLEELARITAPTLTVEGTADPVGPSELVAQTIPNSERLLIEGGADHFGLPLAAEVKSAVLPFINQEG